MNSKAVAPNVSGGTFGAFLLGDVKNMPEVCKNYADLCFNTGIAKDEGWYMKRAGILLVFILYAAMYVTAMQQEQHVEAVKREQIAPEAVSGLELLPIFPEVIFTNEACTEVYFGSMEIQVPRDWKVESRVNVDGQTLCVLIDNHNESTDPEVREHDFFYEHEIEIMAYSVVGMPDSQVQVTADLMDYFGFEFAYCEMEQGTAPADNQWLMTVWADDMRYYCVLSQTEEENWEIFLVQECLFYEFSNDVETFYDMVEAKDIWLDEGYTALEEREVMNRDEYRLFNWDRSDALLIRSYKVKDGYNVLLYQKKRYSNAFEDMFLGHRNGVDGLDIMDINGDGYEDIIQDRWACYSDTDVNFQGYLWNTETQSFDHLSCVELMAEYGEVFEVKKEEYEDLVPAELLTHMSELVEQGREATESTLMQTDVSRQLSGEEVKQLAKQSVDIKLDMLETGAYGSGTWTMVDADNDGIEDVFMEQYAFVEWEGKNYPVWVNYDYIKKMFRGVSVTCHEEGECADWCSVWLKQGEGEDSYEVEMTYLADEKYRPLAETLWEFDVYYDAKDYEPESLPLGTAEAFDDYTQTWKSDLNNDETEERYSKWIFYPSNLGTRRWLVFSLEDVSQERLQHSNRIRDIIDAGEGYAMLMWVDETEFGNVTYVLYEDGLYDFHITAYLIEEDSYMKLLEMEYTFGLEVEITYR